MYLILGALVGMLILVFTHMWDVTRDLRMVVRRQGDELNKAKSDIMEMQAQLADVSFYIKQFYIKHGRRREYTGEFVKRDGSASEKYLTAAELKMAAEHQSRPGEMDQELLLR